MHNTCRKETNMPTGFHNYCDITKGYDTVMIILTNAYGRKYKRMQHYEAHICLHILHSVILVFTFHGCHGIVVDE